MAEEPSYCISVRASAAGRYGDDIGKTSFLAVPPDASDFATSQSIRPAAWVKAVLGKIEAVRDDTGVTRRDLLVFIHGFDNQPPIVLQRHRRLLADLKDHGYKGGLVSFDWPSGDLMLAYVDDREKAKQTAFALVRDCIELFARGQANVDCDVNVHLLAHSMGAYVVQEAFDDADDRRVLSSINWTVSQIAFIAADISASSLANGDPETESIFRHCVRLTNYSSPYDAALQLSNIKRAGLATRVGRVGLPGNVCSQGVNVECGEYYQAMIETRDPKTIIGVPSHSWHIGDPVFSADLLCTLDGDFDRRAFKTRSPLANGQFKLVAPGGLVETAATTPVPVINKDT